MKPQPRAAAGNVRLISKAHNQVMVMHSELKSEILRMLREDEEFRLAVMGLLGYADLKSSVDRLVEAVNELTKLAKAHEERLAKLEERVAGVEDRLSRVEAAIEELVKVVKSHEERLARLETAVEELTKAVKAHEERLARLESAVEELTKIVKEHEERLAKLEERMASAEERLTKVEDRLTRLEAVVEELAKATRENTRAISKLRKAMEHLERRLTGIENMLNNLTISLEDEANHVVQYLLKQRGIEIRTGVTYFDRKFEFDIYGVSEQLTVIGDAKVKAGPQTVRRLVRKVRRAMDKYPDRFKGKVVTVLYCLRALPDAIREAESQGIWLIEDMQQRTTLNI
jgi:chromosome segregation ATPase